MNVLVTGASGGIGRAVVDILIQRGDTVIAQDLQSPNVVQSRLRGPRGDIEAASPEGVTWVAGDLTESQTLETVRSTISAEGLDAVIAAHGIDASATIEDLSNSFLRRAMRVNAGSVMYLLEKTVPLLMSSKGRFVAIASQAGLRAEHANAAYSASKAAVIEFVETLAPSMAQQGVHIRVLCPGCTSTPLFFGAQERFAAAAGTTKEAFVKRREEAIPIKRLAEVEETAAAAVWLSDDRPRPRVFAPTGGEVMW